MRRRYGPDRCRHNRPYAEPCRRCELWGTDAKVEAQLTRPATRAELAALAANTCNHDGIREDCPSCAVDLEMRAEDLRGDQR